jgi:hypothetical protein
MRDGSSGRLSGGFHMELYEAIKRRVAGTLEEKR